MASNRIFDKPNGSYNGAAEYQYVNSIGMAVEVIDPTNLYIVGGRATGKTTQIIARRSVRVIKGMAGAYFAFTGDYYTNLLSNTIPSMIKGWNDMGMKEGVHYVTNERPPASFAKPYKKPLSYKHTISWYNGCFFKLASMDIISSMAGDSYQHAFGDEVKYQDKNKLDKLLPAVRGEKMRFGHSHYYLGKTFTTDMPNILNSNEYDWILDQEKNMDPEQIKTVVQASLIVNEIRKALVKAYIKKDELEYNRQKKLLHRWNQRLAKVRINSTLFAMVSTFANADILQLDYFKGQLKSLGPEQFRPAILTMKHEIKQGEKFYPYLTAKNFYDDGLLLDFCYQFGFGEPIAMTSDGLKYINKRQKLEGGADFGDMISLVTGQEQNWIQRILKDFHTLEQSETVIGEQFREFYKSHGNKTFDLYYDRSGNANAKTKRDWANALKNAIESDNKKVSRNLQWNVNLMSIGQPTIYQEEEFNLMKMMMSETNSKLPKIAIDLFQCKHLKSSMEVAKQIIKPDRNGVNRIHKNKTSESIAMERRPMWSTNMSDAFKYYICRPKYMAVMKDTYISNRSHAPTSH
ncbi:hypothetical protein [Chryseobacterium luquanense]|uniref:Uncharacterized protein n=1 Tax=Chryseobacterium luquanense TaxID=2983766 RepID=A0ABT3Y529_9FLAO|nr:hypothetical protein [Chryseobacterium luquanense]MCX8533106.1 hypothetical protein [Chryseobacterium luquanense]